MPRKKTQAQIIAKTIGIRPDTPAIWNSLETFRQIDNAIMSGRLPDSLYNANYGVLWSLGGCRVNGQIHLTIANMTPFAQVLLVSYLSTLDLKINQTPNVLFELFNGKKWSAQ
jgi:hypothetical protein